MCNLLVCSLTNLMRQFETYCICGSRQDRVREDVIDAPSFPGVKETSPWLVSYLDGRSLAQRPFLSFLPLALSPTTHD